MDIAAFAEEWSNLLRPEADEDGMPPIESPLPRLRLHHGLNFDYFDNDPWSENSSVHRFTRHCPIGQTRVHALTRNQDVPERLFESALQLFADSLVARSCAEDREGDLRYFPPAILTFWAGFETYVRRASELLIATSKSLPPPIAAFLQEREQFVGKNGKIMNRSRFQSVLDRYSLLLQYGYDWTPDKGSKFWQRLVAAKELRDFYTHLDITTPRAISSQEVMEFMEAVLLGMIWPSSAIQRTLMLGIYRVYELWHFLFSAHEPFTERPFFLRWSLQREYLFHCNFNDVDERLFPNMEQRLEQKKNNPN